MSVIQLNNVKCAICDFAEDVHEWLSSHPMFNWRWMALDVVVIGFVVYMGKL